LYDSFRTVSGKWVFICKNTSTIRAGCDKETPQVGDIQANSLVEVVEKRKNADGQVRLHIVAATQPGTAIAAPMAPGGGWASQIAGDGTVLFEEVDIGGAGGGGAGGAGGAKAMEDRSIFSRVKINVSKTINLAAHTARPFVYYSFIPVLILVGMNTEPKPE
jgi:hypothetical protein